MTKRILTTILALLMVLPMALFAVSCATEEEVAMPEEGTYTRVTVDINPSVEFMVDDQNKVVAVTALNDDGSILVAGEAFVGMTPEEAAAHMVVLASETGYLVKGNVEVGENEVKISISGDSKYAEQLTARIEASASAKLEELDIDGKIARAEQLKTEELRALAMQTALFTEEEVAKMDEKQLYSAIAAGRVETALLLTEEMRAAYQSAKETRISFAESRATAEIINAMGGLYQLTYVAYKTAVDTYSAAIVAIDDFRYQKLVSPDSEYQKKLAELRAAKTDLLQQKNYVASLEVNGEMYASATVTLQLTEERYERILAAYETLGANLNQMLLSLIERMREKEAFLRELEASFSEDIKAELQAKAYELEDAANEAKDNFFAEFEAEHKADIEATEAALVARKQELIEAAKTPESVTTVEGETLTPEA